MNREQRRRLEKKTGLSNETIKKITNFKLVKPLKKGQKVKLDYERITGEKDYAGKTDLYKSFVEAHRDDVFTVKYDRRHKDGIMVCFKEDPTWLWHSSDLIIV